MISELHKKLAQRFVYGELKIKFDFKIAQPPLAAQRVTFLFHPCLLPSLPSSFPRLASKQGRISPRVWQAKIHGWGAEGTCLGRDAQHFLQHWTLFQDQHCSQDHSCLWQPGTQIPRYVMKILGAACRFTVLQDRGSPSHSTLHGALLLHLPYPWSTQ